MNTIFTVLLLGSSIILSAQNYDCFDKNYNIGKQLYELRMYKEATASFQAALYGCDDYRNNSDVEKWIARSQAGLIREIEQVLKEKEAALKQRDKIISSFYFYDEKLALAFKDNAYGFINKEGTTKIEYIYEQAQAFNYTGFAEVVRNGQTFLIDTTGEEYLYNHELVESRTEAQALNLSSKGLTDIPKSIFRQKDLKILLLQSNALSRIKLNITRLTRLKQLNLANNNLTKIPLELSELPSLTNLDLSGNALTDPTFGNQIVLRELILSSNKLKELPNLKNMGGLEILRVGNNRLSGLFSQGEFALPNSLKFLDLSNNNISVIPNEISQLSKLVHLNLNGNPIAKLGVSFYKLKKLEILDLRGADTSRVEEVLSAFSGYDKEIIINNSGDVTQRDSSKLLILFPMNSTIDKSIVSLSGVPKLYLNFVNQKQIPEEIFTMDNISVNTWDRFGQQFEQLKSYKTAINCYQKIPENIRNTLRYGNIGECYRKLGNLENAILNYEKLFEYRVFLSRAKERFFSIMLAEQYFQLKDYQRTIDIMVDQAQKYPSDHYYHLFLGYYAIFTEDYEFAIASSQKSLELNSQKSEAVSNLALALVQNGELEKAKPMYEAWKDKEITKGKLGRQVFLEDIQALKEANISLHPDLDKILELLSTVQ